SFTNPLGNQLRVGNYDALGDPGSVTVYPDTGNPATSLQPMSLSIVYNAAQQPVQINSPDGTILQTAFNNGVITQFKTVRDGNTLAQLDLSVDSRGRMYGASDLIGYLGGRRYDKSSN